MKEININFPIDKNVLENSVEHANLSKRQKEKLKQIIKDRTREIKEHFEKSGSWNLNYDLIQSDIVYSLLGIDLSLLVLRYISQECDVICGTDHKSQLVFKNKNDRVFYNEVTDKLYVAKIAKNVNTDINIGLF